MGLDEPSELEIDPTLAIAGAMFEQADAAPRKHEYTEHVCGIGGGFFQTTNGCMNTFAQLATSA